MIALSNACSFNNRSRFFWEIVVALDHPNQKIWEGIRVAQSQNKKISKILHKGYLLSLKNPLHLKILNGSSKEKRERRRFLRKLNRL